MDNTELEKHLFDSEALGIDQGIDDIAPDSYSSDEIDRGMAPNLLETPVAEIQSIIHNKTPILNQGKTSACGTTGISKAVNEMNAIEGSYPQVNAKREELWELMKKEYNASEYIGSTMTNNLKMMRDKGYISGWYKAESEQAQREALARGQLVYIGSRHIDYKKFLYSREAVFAMKETFGHLFARVGYDNAMGVFWHANSWTDKIHEKGLFTTKYGQDRMYTPIVLIDAVNKPVIDQVRKDREMIAEATELKIWNGEKPDNPVVGYELELMIPRAGGENKVNLPNTQTISREKTAVAVALAFGVDEAKIRSHTNPHDVATRRQAVLMIMRAKSLVSG